MHRGHQLAVAMWAMTGLAVALVALRLYTRLRIVKFVGVEDHLYVCTGVFLLLFTATLQVAVHYGLGQSFWLLSLDDSSNAIFWTYIANTFAIAGNTLAKLSMGSFLLRVVQLKGQKIVLWILIVVTVGTSIAWTIMLWNQTTPVKTSWDPLRTPGTWNIQIQPMSVGLGGWSSACDFFFAIFPWLFIWSLRMPRREKIMLASGMSLGVIAGACGVVRTVVLSRLDIMDYTLNFATYFVWAGAEIAVALVCLGIPTLRPLYLKQRGLSTGYGDRAHTHHSDPELPQFDMCDQKPTSTSPQTQHSQQQPATKSPNLHKGPAQPIEQRSPPPAYLRDSSSSHTMVDSVHSPDPPLLRPESAHTRDRSDSDSVYDILGLYDSERSRSRGRYHNKPVPNDKDTIRHAASGVIWVKSEFLVDVERYDSENWPLKA